MILNNKKILYLLMGILIVLFLTGCKNSDKLTVMSKTSTINKVVSKSKSNIFVSGKNMVIESLLADKLLLEKEVYLHINITGMKKPITLMFENAQSQVSTRVIYPDNIHSFIESVKVENSRLFHSKNKSIFKISITTDKGFFFYSEEFIEINITRVIEKNQKDLNRYTKECNNNNVESCVSLADMYYKGIGVAKDMEKAKKILSKACSLDDGKACNNLAWLEEFDKNFDKAHKFYAKACEKNHKIACSNIGFLYENAIGVKRDTKKAKKLYKEACDTGEKIACSNLNELRKKEEEITKAKIEVEKEEKSCNKGETKDCARLGVRYFNGSGLFVDMKKAKKLYEKACKGGNMLSCSNLGLMYATGKGVKIDKEKSIKLLIKACKNWNSSIGCTNLESIKNNVNMYYWGTSSNE